MPAFSPSPRLLSPYLLLLFALLIGSCKTELPTEPTESITATQFTETNSSQVSMWLTTPDKASLFSRQKPNLTFGPNTNQNPTIAVDTTQTFQDMDGFGYTLTGGSAYVMSQMSASSRAALIRELFATDTTSIGVSYLRISIGASDLSSQSYTYDDSATPDPTLANFSIAPEQAYFLPVLKEILAVNPTIKILGTSWTAPSWMKSNNSLKGGTLLTQYYDAYARYFVRYIQAMRAEGIAIDAVTLQNEPLAATNNPSMGMTAAVQAAFIKNNVGPAFRTAGLTTKIVAFDHNPSQTGLDYVNTVLSDAGASPYIDGTAYHWYTGAISNLTVVHNAYPTKQIYFTEQYSVAPGTTTFGSNLLAHNNNLEIGAPRNWSRNVLEWNLATDANYGPHTVGGCDDCLGALTITGNTVTRNVAYYNIAHSSKFVRPGSVRVATNVPTGLQNVAYKTPSGKRVLVVLNTSSALKNFNIQYKGNVVSTSLPGGSVATYVW